MAAGLPRAVGWVDRGDGSITFGATAPGDSTLDGIVDILDAAAIVSSGRFDRPSAATWQQGDFNYDRIVDILDIADFVSTGLFDAGPVVAASVAITPVPEPCVSPLLLVAAAAAALRGWRRAAIGARTRDRSPARRTR